MSFNSLEKYYERSCETKRRQKLSRRLRSSKGERVSIGGRLLSGCKRGEEIFFVGDLEMDVAVD